MRELATIPETQLRHCTLKNAQTIRLVEKNHAPPKQILLINENQTSSHWNRNVDIAVFMHNTIYAPALGCTPSDIFHGRKPVISLRPTLSKPKSLATQAKSGMHKGDPG